MEEEGLNSALFFLPSPAGRQVSLRLAEEAKKRERFEELKQHLEQEQEVTNVCVRVVREKDQAAELCSNKMLTFCLSI